MSEGDYHLAHADLARGWVQHKIGKSTATYTEHLQWEAKLDADRNDVELGALLAILDDVSVIRRQITKPTSGGSAESVRWSVAMMELRLKNRQRVGQLLKHFECCGKCRGCRRLLGIVDRSDPGLVPFASDSQYADSYRYVSNLNWIIRQVILKNRLTLLNGIGKKWKCTGKVEK